MWTLVGAKEGGMGLFADWEQRDLFPQLLSGLSPGRGHPAPPGAGPTGPKPRPVPCSCLALLFLGFFGQFLSAR